MAKQSEATRPLRPAIFALIVLAVGLVLFAVPFPPLAIAKRVLLLHRARAAVAIVGPSTVDYVSACDGDRRTVPAMISDATALPVLDLSAGGQPLSDSVNLAALSAGNASITDIVLPIAYPYSDDWTTPAYSRLLLYKALMPSFPVFEAASLRDFRAGLTSRPERIEQAYRFRDHSYGDYLVLAADQFAREKRLASCPEAVTHDADFTRSYVWWAYVQVGENRSLYDLVAALDARLARAGRHLHVVALPSNLALLERFDPAWAQRGRRGEDRMVSGLARRRVHVLDLSASFAGDEFSTQWCACIHLNEKGRRHLSQAIAADIAQRRTAPRRPAPAREADIPSSRVVDP